MIEILQRFVKFLQEEGYKAERILDFVNVEYDDNFQVEIEYNSPDSVFEFTAVDKKTPFADYPIEAIHHLVRNKFKYKDEGRFLFLEELKISGMFDLLQGLHACTDEFKKIRQIFYNKKHQLDRMNLVPKFLRLKDMKKVYDKNFVLDVDLEYFSKFVKIRSASEFVNFTVFGKVESDERIHTEIYRKKDNDYFFIGEVDLYCSSMSDFLDQCYEKANFYSLDLSDRQLEINEYS